jgi:hypothetical protein
MIHDLSNVVENEIREDRPKTKLIESQDWDIVATAYNASRLLEARDRLLFNG